MKIGIDLRALQTGHKYRGIGEVAKQVSNRVIELGAKDKSVSFVFYEYDDDDPKDLLNMPKGLQFEVVKLGIMPEGNQAETKIQKSLRTLRELYGPPVKDSARCDVFLQFDYAFGVPKNTRSVLIAHDVIPLVFWNKYFISAWVPFKQKAARTTIKTFVKNYKFKALLRRSLRNATQIVTVSDSTRHDLAKYCNVPDSKMKTIHLGVDVRPAKTNSEDVVTAMPTKPYLLFVGAGDARRRVDDLVAAYNNLKAAGDDIQLVLVGENFRKPEHIPNTILRNEILKSSYLSDILTLGYVDDATKQRLFEGALAYVYPTKYEGFGIPVLEAILLDCPVITYKNSSIPEVGGKFALYAKDWQEIVSQVKKLRAMKPAVLRNLLEDAKKHASQFTWDKTAKKIYKELK